MHPLAIHPPTPMHGLSVLSNFCFSDDCRDARTSSDSPPEGPRFRRRRRSRPVVALVPLQLLRKDVPNETLTRRTQGETRGQNHLPHLHARAEHCVAPEKSLANRARTGRAAAQAAHQVLHLGLIHTRYI
jgi:hypothetical protein